MKRKFPFLLVLGIALVAISFLMLVALQIRSRMGADKRQAVLMQMEQLLPEGHDGLPGTYPNANMPILQIDSTDYVALLEIPSLQIALPVADKWVTTELYHSPARFCGSAYDQTLVIGGADDAHQFAFCSKIEHGVLITITDMAGAVFTYQVAAIDRASSADSSWLADSAYHLTLYCQDTDAMEYIAVRCLSTP